MGKAHTEVTVDRLPPCDFCKQDPLVPYQAAKYDGRTKMGPWAMMCEEHFKVFGVGLGLGKGQKLLIRERR